MSHVRSSMEGDTVPFVWESDRNKQGWQHRQWAGIAPMIGAGNGFHEGQISKHVLVVEFLLFGLKNPAHYWYSSTPMVWFDTQQPSCVFLNARHAYFMNIMTHMLLHWSHLFLHEIKKKVSYSLHCRFFFYLVSSVLCWTLTTAQILKQLKVLVQIFHLILFMKPSGYHFSVHHRDQLTNILTSKYSEFCASVPLHKPHFLCKVKMVLALTKIIQNIQTGGVHSSRVETIIYQTRQSIIRH